MKRMVKCTLLVCFVLVASVFTLTACADFRASLPKFHIEETVSAVAPTCTEPGLTEGTRCAACGDVIKVQEIIKPYGHTLVIDEAIPATHTQSGLSEGKHCSVCNEVIVKQEVVPAGHDIVIDKAIAPTCTEPGLTEGQRCSSCGEVIKVQEYVKPNGHTVVIDPAIPPTATSSGLTEGKHCSVCNVIIVKQEIVPNGEHNWVVKNAVDPTCTENGLTQGYYCSICNEVAVEQTVIPALGHVGGVRNCETELCVCDRCGKLYPKLEQYHYLDGTSEEGLYIESFVPDAGYIVPEIKDGYYALINDTDRETEYQFWIDSEEKMIKGFSSKNKAAGYLSFKIDISTYSNTTIILYDSSVYNAGNRYSVGNLSCIILDPAFSVSHSINNEGEHYLSVDGKSYPIKVEGDSTGWYDVKIGIVLNQDEDSIELIYYVDGSYVAMHELELSTVTNAINSVLFMGTVGPQGNIAFDDIVFGYSSDSDWIAKEHAHYGVEIGYTDATCTEYAFNTYRCNACGETYKIYVGNSYGHKSENETCLTSTACDLCGITYVKNHEVTHSYQEGVLTYSCTVCKSYYKIDSGYYLDSSSLDDIVGTMNNVNNNYSVTEGTYNPLIVDGHYELIKTEEGYGQLELWIPSNKPVMDGFSSSDNSIGFVSFKINSYISSTSYPLRMQFVDTNSSASRWSGEWCITSPFLRIDSVASDFNKVVCIRGLNNEVLKEIHLSESSKFTGWIDVTIAIL